MARKKIINIQMYFKTYQYSLSVCPDYSILEPENCLKLPPPKSFYLKKCKNKSLFLKILQMLSNILPEYNSTCNMHVKGSKQITK